MNTNFLLDVAELCLTYLPKESRVVSVDLDVLYKGFQEGNTLCKSNADIHEFKNAICMLFPVYRNNHSSNNVIKISLDAMNDACEELSLRIRPLEHMEVISK